MLSILNKAWLTCGCGETIYPSKVLILIRYSNGVIALHIR
nr:MAG TPA: hypothetical protein [Caudoviricetes sp.]